MKCKSHTGHVMPSSHLFGGEGKEHANGSRECGEHDQLRASRDESCTMEGVDRLPNVHMRYELCLCVVCVHVCCVCARVLCVCN